MKRDLRAYSRSTIFRLIIGGIILLIIMGFILIGLLYNWRAALLGLLCIAGGLLPVILIIAILWFLGKISTRNHRP